MRLPKLRTFCAAALMVASAGVFAVSTAAAQTASICKPDAGRKLAISIGSTGFLYLPLYVAVNAGYAKENGVAVDIQNIGSQASPSFLAGSSDMLYGGFSNVANLRKAGRDVVAVGGALEQIGQFLVLKKTSADKAGIATTSSFEDKIRKMKGMTVGLFTPGTGADIYIRAMAKDVGMNPESDLNLVYLQDEGSISAAFQAGKIDAFIGSAPLATIATVRQGGVVMVSFPNGEYSRIKDSLQMVFVARNDWLKDAEHANAVGCMLAATQRALDLIHSDPEAAKRWAKSSFSNLDDALFDSGFKQYQAAYSKSVVMTPVSVKVALDFEKFLSDKPLNGGADAHVNNTLAEKFTRK